MAGMFDAKPGPWEVTGQSDGRYVTVGNGKQTVARVWGERDYGTALLVAAAPDLYEAVVELLRACDADDRARLYRHPAYRKAVAAVEKAEGRAR